MYRPSWALSAWRSADEERLARLEAGAAREEANQKAQDEEAARKKADAQEKRAQGHLYASRLALVQSYWKEGNLLAARDKLDEVREHRDTWEYRYLYNLLNHRGQRTFLGHAHRVTAVAFNPDGTRLASGSWDQTVKVWDVATGREILSLTEHTGATTSVCWSQDGNRLVSGSSDKTVRVWDAHTGRQLHVLKGHTGSVTGVCFSPDGEMVASSSQDRTVKVWDARNGQLLHCLKGHTKEVSGVAFSPDGKRIASASEDKTVKVWDAQTAKNCCIRSTGIPKESIACASAATANGSPPGAGMTHTIGIAARCGCGTRPRGGRFCCSRSTPGPVLGVSFSPDGDRLASGSGTILRNVPSAVKVWDVRTGKQLLRLQGHNVMVTGVSFSPDGRQIASGSWDQTVRLWDAVTGQEPPSFAGHAR